MVQSYVTEGDSSATQLDTFAAQSIGTVNFRIMVQMQLQHLHMMLIAANAQKVATINRSSEFHI
ncbi:MAG UNVERIFIED_CONTAM: hypothetical protein LVQ98_07170 [Rickettsiaceae bacterium]